MAFRSSMGLNTKLPSL
jgi:hypothetical protein